ncbi:MAG TPA: hypothetical protein VGJ94_04820 [Syntrophorhabdaceae bacterium]|jgi:pimeloyl-ACP methyl ester carboxylesterase
MDYSVLSFSSSVKRFAVMAAVVSILFTCGSVARADTFLSGKSEVRSVSCAADTRENRPSQNIRSFHEKNRSLPRGAVSGLQDDEVFGTYTGYNLDQYLFDSEGPIRFPINITRVISGSKNDYDRIIVGQPKLVLRVWDVDRACGGACSNCCEVDTVYLNGHYIGTLDGATDSWSTFTFDIPVQWFEDGIVNDAAYNGSLLAPTPGENWITINIDTNCGGCWAVQVDYGEIQVQAMRPAVLIHGIKSQANMWSTFKTFIPGGLSEAFDVNGDGDTFTNGMLIQNTHLPHALTSFGVNKVNFIAHSKGGLDTSVALIGNGDKVDNFITLGSPFQGTEAADHFLQAHAGLTGAHDLLLTSLVADALSTATRVDYYNVFSYPEPGVQQYHYAGTEYGAEDTKCLLYRLGLMPWHNVQIFGVENDGWVPLNRSYPPWRASVNLSSATSHTDKWYLQPSTPASPRGMAFESAVGQWAVNIMRASATGIQAVRRTGRSAVDQRRLSQYLASLKDLKTSASSQQAKSVSVSMHAGESLSVDVFIDTTVTELRFYLFYGPDTGNVQVTLTTPTGSTVSPSQNSDFRAFAYEGAKPAAGTWKVNVHAIADSTVKGAVEVVTSLALTASADKDTYAQGEAVTLTARLAKGSSGVTGATVQASFIGVSGTVAGTPCALADKGGGNYQASCSPSGSGTHSVLVTAQGTSSGRSFERDVYIPKITVTPAGAHFNSVSSTNPSDTNGNGLYDTLTVQATVQVVADGQYSSIGTLSDPSGTVVANAATISQVTAGTRTISLVFDGKTIRRSGKDGPYTLARFAIYDVGHNGLVVDERTDVYTTAGYHSYDFEGSALSLGTGIDQGTDANGDGLFDTLNIEVDVVVSPGYEGTYAFNAQLTDANGTGIVWYSNSSKYLAAGSNTLQFSYSGTDISSSGLAGPYRLANFTLYNLGDSTISLSSAIAYTTGTYLVCQFQGATPCNRTLTVTATGNGAVTSTPGGIACGATCAGTFVLGTPVTLTATATPGSGYSFSNWTGECGGTFPICQLTMTEDTSTGARFVSDRTKRFFLTTSRTRANNGDGTIVSDDRTINCGPGATTCRASYYKETPITLSATAARGSYFTGWKPASLGCAATGSCTVAMNAAKTIQATFVGPQKLTVVKQSVKKGSGTVTSAPAGISCTGTAPCSAYFPLHQAVTLTASPAGGSTFTGWKPASLRCSGVSCTVTMDKALTVTAVFTKMASTAGQED